MGMNIVNVLFIALGIANAGATGALWYRRLRFSRELFRRQDRRVVFSLIALTISCLSYLILLGGWWYNPRIYIRGWWYNPRKYIGPAGLDSTLILLGLLTASYAFFCTMEGDQRSRAERIRIFISSLIAGMLWLFAIVTSSLSQLFPP